MGNTGLTRSERKERIPLYIALAHRRRINRGITTNFNSCEKTETNLMNGITQTLKEGKVPDPTSLNEAENNLNEGYDNTANNYQQAKAEFEKIKGLQGVDEYVQYANLSTQAIDASVGCITSSKEMAQWLTNFFPQSPSTIRASATEFQNQIAQLTENMSAQASKTDESKKTSGEFQKIQESLGL